jgi:hypothetical protein
MRILIVTDAWSPQVNGVVTTVRNTVRELELLHHHVGMITPDGFRTLPCPTYPEIRLAIAAGTRVSRMIEEFIGANSRHSLSAPTGVRSRDGDRVNPRVCNSDRPACGGVQIRRRSRLMQARSYRSSREG